jgi:hypothetical protein
MVTKPTFISLLYVFLWAGCCQAFTTLSGYNAGRESMLNLHPDQAEELVECARDHIRKQTLLKRTEVAGDANILSLEISETLKKEAMARTTTGVPIGVGGGGGGDDNQFTSNHSHHYGPMMLSWVRKRLWPFKLQRHVIATTAIASRKLP